jgi:ribosomal protein S18 acetylase RimI-like enzyme
VRTVRRANLTDADAVGSVEVRAWRAVHEERLGADALAEMDPAERAEQWRELLRDPAGGRDLLVVIDAGAVVGFAAIGASRDLGAPPSVGEIEALNLVPDAWGRGLASELLTAAVDELRRRGFSEVTTWVPVTNDRARRFYDEHGWREDGERQRDSISGRPVERVRTRRPLT